MISILFPVFNESGNIEKLLERTIPILKKTGIEYEIIFINDASKDNSLQILKDLKDKRYPEIKIISFSRNFGHTAALVAGMKHSRGQAVIMMDSDLQHPPEIIPEMITKWKEGYENIYAIRTRYKKEKGFKKITSFLYYKLFNFLTGLKFPNNVADFRLLDSKVIEKYNEHIHERKLYLRGLIFWLGFKQIGITYEANEREYGKSSYALKNMLLLALNGITSFTLRPLYLALYLGLFFFVFALVYGVWIFISKFYFGTAIKGWSSLAFLMVLISSVQFIILGIFGIYLGHLFEEVKRRPLYIVDEAIGFQDRENIKT